MHTQSDSGHLLLFILSVVFALDFLFIFFLSVFSFGRGNVSLSLSHHSLPFSFLPESAKGLFSLSLPTPTPFFFTLCAAVPPSGQKMKNFGACFPRCFVYFGGGLDAI